MDLNALLGNQLVSGGLLLMVSGAALAYARRVPQTMFGSIKKRFIYSVDIQSNDVAFRWVLEWLHHHPSSSRIKTVTLLTRFDDEGSPYLTYSPLGNHFIFYNRKFIWISRAREKQKGDGGLISLYENLEITAFTRKRGVIEKLIDEAHEFSKAKENSKIGIFAGQSYGGWKRLALREKRAIKSVILPPETIKDTLEDIVAFQERKQWYTDVGVPYRRGYLLKGPPGNGKTSLIFAIASELETNLYVLSLSSNRMDDDGLLENLGSIPAKGILLLEDIDAVFEQRELKNDDVRVTFSGLLNALDGVASAEGRILFMTTNHPEKLDPALIRPGRVDKIVEIGPPTKPEIIRLYHKLSVDDKAEEFAASIPEGMSAAQIQERLIGNV